MAVAVSAARAGHEQKDALVQLETVVDNFGGATPFAEVSFDFEFNHTCTGETHALDGQFF